MQRISPQLERLSAPPARRKILATQTTVRSVLLTVSRITVREVAAGRLSAAQRVRREHDRCSARYWQRKCPIRESKKE